MDRELAEIESLVVAAHFRTALGLAKATRPLFSQDVSMRERAQLELLVATAEIALGRRGEARAAVRRALEAEPGLHLDRTISPKVRALFQEARRTALRGGS